MRRRAPIVAAESVRGDGRGHVRMTASDRSVQLDARFRALAQEPRALVLDEPTSSLDIKHEMTTFEFLARLRGEGVTVLIATHNLNLAARYSDAVVLMERGRVVAQGAPADVITTSTIEAAYDWPVDITTHRGGAPQISPRSRDRRDEAR